MNKINRKGLGEGATHGFTCIATDPNVQQALVMPQHLGSLGRYSVKPTEPLYHEKMRTSSPLVHFGGGTNLWKETWVNLGGCVQWKEEHHSC